VSYKERESQALKEDANRLIRRVRALPIFESDSNQAATGIQFWVEEVLLKLAAVEWADNAILPVPVDESAVRAIKREQKEELERLEEQLQNV
jgi:hypothetical protein